MHGDLLDGVRWAIDQGIADTSRVATMGGSYGCLCDVDGDDLHGRYLRLRGQTSRTVVGAAQMAPTGPSRLGGASETAGQRGLRLPTGLRRSTLGLEQIRFQFDYVFFISRFKFFIL